MTGGGAFRDDEITSVIFFSFFLLRCFVVLDHWPMFGLPGLQRHVSSAAAVPPVSLLRFVSLLMYRHVHVCFTTRREKRWISAHKKEIIAPQAASFTSCLKWFLQTEACLSRNYRPGGFLSLSHGCFHVAAFVFCLSAFYESTFAESCRWNERTQTFAVIKKKKNKTDFWSCWLCQRMLNLLGRHANSGGEVLSLFTSVTFSMISFLCCGFSTKNNGITAWRTFYSHFAQHANYFQEPSQIFFFSEFHLDQGCAIHF